MAEPQLFPGGQLAIGNGVAQYATTMKLDANNNAKLVHTMAQSPAGYSRGNTEISGSFDSEIPAVGEDFDTIQAVVLGTPKTFRFKIPGSVKIIQGLLNSASLSGAAGESCKMTANFIGWVKNI